MKTTVAPRLTLAVIGDVHDQWQPIDRLALHHLGVDLALFVGDFGNEAVELVGTIAALDIPIAVALGNHDAWYTATPWGQQKCPYDRQKEDRVQQQLDLLSAVHTGYENVDFPDLGLAVVGGRPFSWGGPEWKYEPFYQERFGVANFKESIERIVQAGQRATAETLIMLSHNGPAGLGDGPEAPCGRDWQPLGGDYGDPDLQTAIAQLKAVGKTIPLVAFGHMHHHLRHTRRIQRTAVVYQDQTVYLNAACVPRIIPTPDGSHHNFSLVTLQNGRVEEVALVWLDQDCELVSRQVLYSHTPATDSLQPLFSREGG
uniref:Metallophosphoesterase n=1 Tax=Cyanothece sp. (strain PCC 7425 / ATCC 29141) TaxID=395961 RepID=B8HS04_CYAP4